LIFTLKTPDFHPGFLWQNRVIDMQIPERKVFLHNVVFNLLDGGFFGFGLGFASFTTILPLFVSMMTSSALLIGLIPAIHNVGWQFPQLLTADRINRLEKFKPFVMLMTLNERLPFLGFAIVGLLLPHIGSRLALVLTFLLLIWQGLGAGFTANAWQNLISKVIPADAIATFLGSQSSVANLLSSIGAVFAGIILLKVSAPYNFSVCFIAAVICFTISWICLNQTKESPRLIPIKTDRQAPMWKSIKHILKTDKIFLNFLISRFLSQFGMMSFAFYTVFAVKKIGMDNLTIGIMTSVLLITQTIANPVLGWLSDHWSRKWILVLGSICALFSAFFAFTIHQPDLFAIVFILCGIANVAYWTIGMTFALEFGNEFEKPIYVGMSNTLIAPATILSPLLGGLLADLFGYAFTFQVSAIFGLIIVVLLIIFVTDPKKPQTRILTS
jgi:MFS family permease